MGNVLEGKKILITRPKDQAETLSAALSAIGAIPICFPLIETSIAQNNPDNVIVFNNIEIFDWIIFPSMNAAKYFLVLWASEIKETNKSLFDKIIEDDISIAAVGSKTANYLLDQGIKVDYIPETFTAAALAENIPNISGKRILIPRTDIGDETWISILKNRGSLVSELMIYHTTKTTGKRNELQNLIDNGLNVITFASPSAVVAFYEMEADPKNCVIACIGPVTAEKVQEFGKKPDIVAKTYTVEGLTEAIVAYFGN